MHVTRRSVILAPPALAAFASGISTAGACQTASDDLYHDLAALLDPKAYEYTYLPNYQTTVPPGKAWYALNLWFVYINGAGPYFHRRLNIADALLLTAGTTISTDAFPGFIYLCKPELVSYVDPVAKYHERLQRMREIAQSTLMSTVPSGSPLGFYTGAAFPTGDYSGLLNHVSTSELAWTIMAGNAVKFGGGGSDHLNTLDEVNNQQAIQFTGNILCPFRRSEWNGIWTQAGSVLGDGGPSNAGTGIVIYQVLPPDW